MRVLRHVAEISWTWAETIRLRFPEASDEPKRPSDTNAGDEGYPESAQAYLPEAASGPPAHWLELVNSGPPKHWIELVERIASARVAEPGVAQVHMAQREVDSIPEPAQPVVTSATENVRVEKPTFSLKAPSSTYRSSAPVRERKRA